MLVRVCWRWWPDGCRPLPGLCGAAVSVVSLPVANWLYALTGVALDRAAARNGLGLARAESAASSGVSTERGGAGTSS